MNVELPSFKSGEHNSESESTIDRVITLLKVNDRLAFGVVFPSLKESQLRIYCSDSEWSFFYSNNLEQMERK